MTIQEFYTELEKHDWFYMMSDDPMTEKRGSKNWDRLNDLCQNKPEWFKLLGDYHDYVWSGIGTPKLPKPIKPQ